jgi:hypothetical protein
MQGLPSDAPLNAIDQFVSEIAYASDVGRWAVVLQLAVGHATGDIFPTRGHTLIRAKGPKCGKTTLGADVPMLLGHNPWKVGKQTTDPAIMHKFFDAPPLLICDDIGKVFGDSGQNGKTTTLYSILIDGYRKRATVSMSRNSVTQDVPAYAMAWLNGLHNAVPGDLETRCVRIPAVKRPRNVSLRSALSPDSEAEAAGLRELLHAWVAGNKEDMKWFALNRVEGLHEKLFDREAQIWGPMFAVANSAGGDWPARCMQAFITLELDGSNQPLITPDQQLVLDSADVCKALHLRNVFLPDLVTSLRLIPDKVYSELSDMRLLEKLDAVLGEPTQITGKNLAGKHVRAEGWLCQTIYNNAATIRKQAYPKAPESGPSTAERRMSFTTIGA